MNEEEIKSLVDQLKGAGLEEEDIMDVFYSTFSKGKMDRKDLETLANYMGYELTDDFKNDPTPDPITNDVYDGSDDEISKEDLEEAKEIGPDETTEEFEEKLEDMTDGESNDDDDYDYSDDESEETDESDEDEDKEWEEAQRIFKI